MQRFFFSAKPTPTPKCSRVRLLWSEPRWDIQLQAIQPQEPFQTFETVQQQQQQELVKTMNHATTPLIGINSLPNYLMSRVVQCLVQLPLGVEELTQSGTGHSVAGRVAMFAKKWEVITSDHWVLKCVRGYEIDFFPKEIPFQEEEKPVILAGVQKMLAKNAIPEMNQHDGREEYGICIPALYRTENEWRHTTDHQLETFESVCTTGTLQNRGNSFAERPAQTGRLHDEGRSERCLYLTIPINPSHQNFRRFVWEGKTYQSKCLPFGLLSAAWVLTKTSQALVLTLKPRSEADNPYRRHSSRPSG